jgi:hypothetical protein
VAETGLGGCLQRKTPENLPAGFDGTLSPVPFEGKTCGIAAIFDSYEVKTLSPHDRFVIALHSPDGAAESGLCVCPPEKSARKLAFGVRLDTFSSAV